MPCEHLKELFQLCEKHQLKITSGEMVRFVCPQCGLEEVCPSVYSLEYETRHNDEPPGEPSASPGNGGGDD